MRLLSPLLTLTILGLSTLSADLSPKQQELVAALQPRQPNWRHEIAESYPNGFPKRVIFYEPSRQGERPVRQQLYFEEGIAQSEMDVVPSVNDEGNPCILPHGVKIDFSKNGEILAAAQFDRGQLHGEFRRFYPNGAVQSVARYYKGELEGLSESFYEDGKKQETANYIASQLDGEKNLYYPDGSRAALLRY